MTSPDPPSLPAAPTLGQRHLRFWQARLEDEKYVYVLRAGKRNPIKIGSAKNPERRLTTLQTGNAATLRLLLVVPGGEPLERALHERFKAARMANGEWFGGRSIGPIIRFVNRLSREMVKHYEATGEVPDFKQMDLWHGGKKPPEIKVTIHQPPMSPQNRPPWPDAPGGEGPSYVPTLSQRIVRSRIRADERGTRAPMSQ